MEIIKYYLIFTLTGQSPASDSQVGLHRQYKSTRHVQFLGNESAGCGGLCVATDLTSKTTTNPTNFYYNTGNEYKSINSFYIALYL